MLQQNKKSFIIALIVCLAFSLVLAGCGNKNSTGGKSAVDSYPKGNITLFVVHGAGGAGDILARALQPFLQKTFGANVVIENVSGGGGNDAYAKLIKAKPDGYTILLAPFPSAILGELTKNGDFHVKDFTYLYNVAGNDSNAIYVKADSPYQDLKSLVEAAKAGKVTMAGSGIGTNSHMAITLLQQTSGAKFEYIPYESGKGGVIGVLGGHTDAGISNIIDLKDLADQKKIRILTSFGVQRHPKFPNVPTSTELGYENTGMNVCTGIVGPPNMPEDLSKKISDLVAKAVADPEFQKTADSIGTNVQGLPANEFKSIVMKIYEQADSVKDFMKAKK